MGQGGTQGGAARRRGRKVRQEAKNCKQDRRGSAGARDTFDDTWRPTHPPVRPRQRGPPAGRVQEGLRRGRARAQPAGPPEESPARAAVSSFRSVRN